jgi:hypothetical protein
MMALYFSSIIGGHRVIAAIVCYGNRQLALIAYSEASEFLPFDAPALPF